MITHVIRPARRAELPELTRVLGIAFTGDPIAGWLIPDQRYQTDGLQKMFTALVHRHYLAVGGVDVAVDNAGTIVGVALWAPPGHWHTPRLASLRMLPLLVRAFRTRFFPAMRMFDRMAAAHPRDPHWYLSFIGTLPQVRRQGFAQSLLNSRLAHCDTTNTPAYLESSNIANVPYYERFGFESIGELHATDGGPPQVPMWRAPQRTETP